METVCGHDPVKTACESEQTLSVQRYMRFKTKSNLPVERLRPAGTFGRVRGPRIRMGLWSGVRARFDTISIMVITNIARSIR